MDVAGGPRLNLRQDREPRYPHYGLLQDREKSFSKYEWPVQISQTGKELASAGLFYTGYGDQTLCFSCGNGLKRWMDKDDPFEEHARHHPKCNFLVVSKGQHYIDLVQAKHKTRCWEKLLPQRSEENEGGEPAVAASGAKECLICTTEERQIAFQPCGHFTTCINCSFNLTKCCMCRANIVSRIRIFSP